MLKQLKKTGLTIFLITGLGITSNCVAVLPEVSIELQRVMRDFSNRLGSTVGSDTQWVNELAELANQGDPVAAYLYAAQIDESDPALSKKMLGYASSKGCTAASTILGTQQMASGESRDAGLRLMHESAYSGDPLAQLGLSGHYLTLGDPIQAYAWFKLAYREFSGLPLMKITLDTQRGKFENGLSASKKESAEIHYMQLEATVKRMPAHICASSAMSMITIPPQNVLQAAKKQDSQVPLGQTTWKLFDHPNLANDPTRFQQIKSGFQNSSPVLVLVTASWNFGTYEIEQWINSDRHLQQLLNRCNVIVSDVSANQELPGLYEGDIRSVPVYAIYKKAADKQPGKTRSSNFQSAQEFKEFVEEACIR